MWVRRYRETGSVAPGKIGGYKPNVLGGAHGDWLIERTDTDFTLRGLVAELAARGVKVDYVQVWRFVHARGLSFKKSVLPAEQLRPKIARRRAQWQKYQGWPGVTDLVAGFDGQLVAAHQAALLPSSTPNRASARSSKL